MIKFHICLPCANPKQDYNSWYSIHNITHYNQGITKRWTGLEHGMENGMENGTENVKVVLNPY